MSHDGGHVVDRYAGRDEPGGVGVPEIVKPESCGVPKLDRGFDQVFSDRLSLRVGRVARGSLTPGLPQIRT